ncbi:hypothetical protein QQZ08_008518 [Neonectria magnoliae]|uniref:C2H2-type domain-containing protein n=1 Tax=Neonectria magnoliae TaxID=2732573 RepID=A0ABR1HTU8_9HYPO
MGRDYSRDPPIPDPRRLEFFYCKGLTVSIRRHVPPPPFSVCYPKGAERQESKRCVECGLGFNRTEWCLKHPPAEYHAEEDADDNCTEAAPHADADDSLHHLYVMGEIACEDGQGA